MITLILSQNDVSRFGGIDALKKISAAHSRNIYVVNYCIIKKGKVQWLEN
jgi:hypothetical protein